MFSIAKLEDYISEAMGTGERIYKTSSQFRDRYSGAVEYPNESLPATYLRNAQDVSDMQFKTSVIRQMGKKLEATGQDNVVVNYTPQAEDFKLYKDQEKADFAYEFDV